MAKYKSGQSSNIIDIRNNRRAKDIYNKSQGYDGPTSDPLRTEDSRANFSRQMTSTQGPTSDQRQSAQALGLQGNLADLQNTANKMQAVRRTRMAGADLPEEILLKRMQRR